MNDDIRKDLDSLDGQTIVLPNNVQVYIVDGAGNKTEVPSAKGPTFKVIECNGDAFEAYQDALDCASDVVTKAIVGRHSTPIVEPINRDKAWNESVTDGKTWSPKDKP